MKACHGCIHLLPLFANCCHFAGADYVSIWHRSRRPLFFPKHISFAEFCKIKPAFINQFHPAPPSFVTAAERQIWISLDIDPTKDSYKLTHFIDTFYLCYCRKSIVTKRKFEIFLAVWIRNSGVFFHGSSASENSAQHIRSQSKALRNIRHAAHMDTYDPPQVYTTPPAKAAQGKAVYSMISSNVCII
jgi:hypothetical protein